MKTLLAAVLILVSAIASVAQAKPTQSLKLSPAFRELALDVFDRVSSLPFGIEVPDSVYLTKRSDADVLLSKLRRTATTKEETRINYALLDLFYKTDLCRQLAAVVSQKFGACLDEKSDMYETAMDLLGIKSNKLPPGNDGGALRVGGGVSAPKAIYAPDPEYSEEARKAKYQGVCVLWVTIGPDGRAHDIRPARTLGLGLDEKAIEAVKNWRFEPAMQDGKPVAVRINLGVCRE